jgi:ATP:ADP antiporter, AAA family
MARRDCEFSRIRSLFWPIYRSELAKFIPMIAIFFLICFNYHLLRIIKDSLIITQKHSGAEVIPYLKVWVILPSAFLMTYIFTKLSYRFKREYVFYIMCAFFLTFFLIFIFYLYPNSERLNLDTFANSLQTTLPSGMKGLIAIIRYWSFSLFYVIAESWSTIMYSVILWGFANEVTSIKEARRYYAIFGIGVNSSGILAGMFGTMLSTTSKFTSSPKMSFLGKTPWDQQLSIFIIMIIVCTLIAIVLYRYLHIKFFSYRNVVEKNPLIKKPKMSLRKSLSYVAKSKYLLYIAMIVLSYNLLINITEVLWKSQVREFFPTTQGYTAYMSRVTCYIGIIATLASFFITGNMVRRLGWRITALATPIIIIISGVCFFYFLFLKQYFYTSNSLIPILGMTPLALTVFFGSIQNCLTRSAKYSVFDDSKEMTFIPLSPESKLIGKSAIDGIGSRLGKSGSSLILQFLFLFFATPVACAPIILGIIALVIPVWIHSINSLSVEFNKLTTIKSPQPDKSTSSSEKQESELVESNL